MLVDEQLAYKLSELAMGRVAIRDFEEWFVQSSWNANAWASPSLREAVYSLELVLAEYSNQHVSHSYLRASAGEVARGLRASMNGIRPALVGSGMSRVDVMKARVPLLTAA
jgi:hypothetical protein